MSPIEALKSEAAALQETESAQGNPMKHCEALERVAKKHGYDSWRACLATLSSPKPSKTSPSADEGLMRSPEMKTYRSSEWNFELEIPKSWNSFPPVSSNSPFELIRFSSHENGYNLLIVFRMPTIHGRTLANVAGDVQQTLTKAGFGNFTTAEATLGTRPAVTLDFDMTRQEGIWNSREYFVSEGTLVYALGFGTNNRAKMFDLFDRMARSFVIHEDPPAAAPSKTERR
jgi:hypothetical protein